MKQPVSPMLWCMIAIVACHVFSGSEVRAAESASRSMASASSAVSQARYPTPFKLSNITRISVGIAEPKADEALNELYGSVIAGVQRPPFPIGGHLYVVLWSNPQYILLQAGPSGNCRLNCGYLVPQNYPQSPTTDPQVTVSFGDGSTKDLTKAANCLDSEQGYYRAQIDFPPYHILSQNSSTYAAAVLSAYGCSASLISNVVETLESESHRRAVAWPNYPNIVSLLEPSGSPPPNAPVCGGS
jgi:hypothetical protein